MNYSVILDETHSAIIPSEQGTMSFSEAISHILQYVQEAGYDMQEAIFESILQDGEQSFLDGKTSVVLA